MLSRHQKNRKAEHSLPVAQCWRRLIFFFFFHLKKTKRQANNVPTYPSSLPFIPSVCWQVLSFVAFPRWRGASSHLLSTGQTCFWTLVSQPAGLIILTVGDAVPLCLLFVWGALCLLLTCCVISEPLDKPLTNMKILVLGKLSKNKEEVKSIVEDLGGKMTTTANKATLCISTQSEQPCRGYW